MCTQEFRVGEGAAVAHHSTLLLPIQSVPSTQYVTIAEERLTSLRAKQLELLGLLATTKGNAEYQVGGTGRDKGGGVPSAKPSTRRAGTPHICVENAWCGLGVEDKSVGGDMPATHQRTVHCLHQHLHVSPKAAEHVSLPQAMRQTQSLRDMVTRLETELAGVNKSLEASQAEVADLIANATNKEKGLVKVRESGGICHL